MDIKKLSPIQQEREYIFDAFRKFLSEEMVLFQETGFSALTRYYGCDMHSAELHIDVVVPHCIDIDEFWRQLMDDFMNTYGMQERASEPYLDRYTDDDIFDIRFTINGVTETATIWCGFKDNFDLAQGKLPNECKPSLDVLREFLVQDKGNTTPECIYFNVFVDPKYGVDFNTEYIDDDYVWVICDALSSGASELVQCCDKWEEIEQEIRSGEWTTLEQLESYLDSFARDLIDKFLNLLPEKPADFCYSAFKVTDARDSYSQWFPMLTDGKVIV